ncbi:MAG: aminopeptidase, partial [Clostridiales bacterium]|nr:aminopeptidase [Clostridiales bacterium]
MSKEKSTVEKLQEKLLYKPTHSALVMSEEQIEQADKFCDGYISFLNSAKTEREVAAFMKDVAISKGFVEFDNTKK